MDLGNSRSGKKKLKTELVVLHDSRNLLKASWTDAKNRGKQRRSEG